MLDDLENRTSDLFIARAKRFWIAQSFVKIFLILIPSVVMGISQYNQVILLDGKVNWWNIAGIVAAVLVGAGGILLLTVEKDASEELATAHQAINVSRQMEDNLSRLDDFVGFAEQSIYLSQAYSAMRNSIEQSLNDNSLTIDDCVEGMLEVSMRQLEAAAAFEPGRIWTICVYKAVKSKTLDLKLVADRRAVKCERKHARSWPIGVGPAGVALATGSEVVIDDLNDPKLGTTFRLPKDLRREHDDGHYRSMIAVPIW